MKPPIKLLLGKLGLVKDWYVAKWPKNVLLFESGKLSAYIISRQLHRKLSSNVAATAAGTQRV